MSLQTIQSDTFPFPDGRLKFLDSMQFLSGSLDKLSAQMKPEQFFQFKKCYPNEAVRKLLTKKGTYSYSYMNSMARFEENSLPNDEAFYDDLKDKPISKKEREHADNVWNGLGCKTMLDYHNHYLQSDILLLADVFETFRKMSLDTYKLDPCHCYSLLGLSWDAMLRYTKVEIELITDLDMYQMVERGIRGGIS